MKLIPLADRVVLKQSTPEEKTKSGIILTSTSQEKPQQAEVIAVGPGGVVDGKEVVMNVKPGDMVIFSKYAGNEVKLDDEEYIIVKQSDILAIVELILEVINMAKEIKYGAEARTALRSRCKPVSKYSKGYIRT